MAQAEVNPLVASEGRGQSNSIISHAGKDYINIMALPADVQAHMRAFDKNGDGKIRVDDLASLAKGYHVATESGAQFKKIAMFLALLMVVMILAGFGLSFAVFELTRDTIVDDHVMKGIDLEPLQIASTDVQINNGALVSRESGRPVQTADSKTHVNLEGATSTSPDDFWREMSVLDVSDEHGNAVYFPVNGWFRSMNGNTDKNLTASTVTLVTAMGKIFVHGDEFSFDDDAVAILKEAGFPTNAHPDKAGRHLLFFGGSVVSFVIGALVGVAVCSASAGFACPAMVGLISVGVKELHDDDDYY